MQRSLVHERVDLLGMGQWVLLGMVQGKEDGQPRNIQEVLTSPIHCHPFSMLELDPWFSDKLKLIPISAPALVCDIRMVD